MEFKNAKDIEEDELREAVKQKRIKNNDKDKIGHIDDSNKNEDENPKQKENSILELNKEQKKAINIIDGNLLILASAGTGKTTTIVERYVNMVKNHDYKPSEIMMTTFTNKAAKDMKNKIKQKTENISPWIGTMHSLFLKILKKEDYLDKDYNLLTSKYEKKKIIKRQLNNRDIETKTDLVNYIIGRISKFKNAGVLPNQLDANQINSLDNEEQQELIDNELITTNTNMKEMAIKVYQDYQKYLEDTNSLDFDDILLLTLKLLRDDEEVRKKYKNKFKSIMVDEAQDLNVVQIRILRLLEKDDLCLIGDDCQNIYQWRGSSNKLVFDFEKNHNKIILKNNYRSTEEIINAVNKIIDSLNFKLDKKLECTRIKGKKICINSFREFQEELDYVAKETERLIKSGVNEDQIAVLFRTNRIGKQAERIFRAYRIPCHLTRSQDFFEREEVRDILSFLKLKINPKSRHNFERVSSLIRGVGEKKIDQALKMAQSHNTDFVSGLLKCRNIKNNRKLRKKVGELKRVMRWDNGVLGYNKENSKNPINEFLDFFNYHNYLFDKYKDSPRRIEDKERNIELLLELYQYGNDKDGLREYLDSLIRLQKGNKGGKVTLSTVHSAKGLEWEHIFLIGCNEKTLPFYRGDLKSMKRDEELRLFYVAVSRTKDSLTITYSNHTGWRKQEPSQFLKILK